MKYITVTRAIPRPEGLDKVHPDVLDAASERGTKAHAAVNGYCFNIQNPDSIHWSPPIEEEIQPYFESGKQWIDKYIDTILYIECEVFHPLYLYLGHPDLIAILKGDKDPSIIDFKTPIQYQERHWSAQLAGYKEAALKDPKIEVYNIEKLLSVRIRANGKMALVNQVKNEAMALNGFLNALGSYRYFKT